MSKTQSLLQPNPKRWKALALLGFANFIVMMDSAVVQVALPSIKDALGYTEANLQWVMNAFLIMFGGLLLLGGKLSDLFGHRRIFMWGISILAVSSLFAGLAWNEMSLNIGRGIQGVGSALIAPSALSIVMILFSANKKELGKALAVWGLSGAAGGALGIVLGGVLTQLFSWRWTLLFYVPISIIVMYLAPKLLQKGTPKTGRIDYAGAIAVTAALVLIVYGIVNVEQNGWQALSTVLPLVMGGILFIIFILIQMFRKDPLVPLSIFKAPNLAAGNISLILLSASWFPLIYFLILYLQQVMKYEPFEAAMGMLPAPILMAIFMIVLAERVMNKLGMKITMMIGFIILGIAGLLFSGNTVNGHYWGDVFTPLLLAALGNALAYLPATTAAVSEAKSEESGLASGLYNTTYQIGSAVGLAVIVSIAAAATASATGAKELILNEGYQQAFFWCGIVAFAGALLALLFVRTPEK
ncbi:MFS transporter [Mesobacillus foraminis]|uniref:EmrB/QacA subfamily drug resistance transporter n=1 Tax=Mesobacillus foraminis TaxID=279826 RepID=A0A4R2BLI1_9BACI|nr:MFS transporter [Mesobacillus foraminis]TCN28117.1 EmrB/QacA subfamily drug resistance transporter [Mesobacillus foraminis]